MYSCIRNIHQKTNVGINVQVYIRSRFIFTSFACITMDEFYFYFLLDFNTTNEDRAKYGENNTGPKITCIQ